eukprot:CAMPEP_0176073798 /NCGR_PEP_ID=MMETSP0120_2-20121206/36875_1 /TAXON_ID=160619 /ORGANISM="Kryptoperidinium foliaceum, Strain CCMP 1326" /LENGTH=419 /DNA_ID=CAMNT_0017407483 /DNA_START=20 /DNA_END=1276 /DNA_ORIENTATION=+
MVGAALHVVVAALFAVCLRLVGAGSVVSHQTLSSPEFIGMLSQPPLHNDTAKTSPKGVVAKGNDAEEVALQPETSTGGPHVPLYAYPSVFALVTFSIAVIYGKRGIATVMSVMVYLAALSTMKLSVKWVFVKYTFGFPRFVTCFHFLCSGLVCLAMQLWRRSQHGAAPMTVPTTSEFIFMVMPIAVADASVSIGADNMALRLSSVAFAEILGSTTCIFTAVVVILMGLPFNKWLFFPIIAVAVGCTTSSVGELHASVPGMVLIAVANAFRALKASLQQKLMTGKMQERFDPCTLLMWFSVPATILACTTSLVFEGAAPIRQMSALDSRTFRGLCIAIGVSCVNAVVLNLSQLFVTKSLGAVGGQLVGQAKAVLTVLGGVALFGDRVTVIELLGFAEVLGGVYAYSAMEGKAREAFETNE